MTRSWRSPALLAGLLLSLAVFSGPIFNPDLGWHLAAGRAIAASRAIPRADVFSWSKAGSPWIDFEWGTQLIFYSLMKLGGLPALWVFKALAFLGLALIFTAVMRQWDLDDAWSAFALPPFALTLFPMSDIRPEVFSLLFFMLQFLVLERRRLGLWRVGTLPTLALHVGAYAFWVNLHAGFVTGLLLCAVYGAAEVLRERRAPGLDSPWAWAVAAVGGTFLNPYGPNVYSVFLEHWRDRALLRELVIEWETPNFLNGYMSGYWLLMGFSFAGYLVAIAQGAPIAWEHLATIVVFGLFASRAFRTTSYAALLLFPLGLSYWSRVSSPSRWLRIRPFAIGLLTIVCVWRTVSVLREQRYDHPLAVLEDYGPQGGVHFLQKEKAVLGALHIYNPWNWGGYMDWHLFPDFRVYMDGRYIFTDMLAEIRDAQSQPAPWRQFLDRRGIDMTFLYNDGHMIRLNRAMDWRPFITFAMPRAQWALVYWDAQSLILVRRSKVPADWLKDKEYRILRPHDMKYVGLLLVDGHVTRKVVVDEMDRYERTIGDPLEVAKMRTWLKEFDKGQPLAVKR